MKSKICGISDSKTLNFIINHKYPPQFIGFIVNYPKSRRFIEFKKLNDLINIDKKKISFVAVLVKPNHEILEKIKDLNFDFYQIYDCTPEEIRHIRQKYKTSDLGYSRIRIFQEYNEIVLQRCCWSTFGL